jgi:hypothetical protein
VVPNQSTLTVIAPIQGGEQAIRALRRLFAPLREELWKASPWEQRAPFLLETIHFARFVILEPERGPDGVDRPACLLFSTQYDGCQDDHLDALAMRAGAVLRPIFAHCAGFQAYAGPPGVALRRFLEQHAVRTQAFYIGARGRTVGRILEEARIYVLTRHRIEQGGLPADLRERYRAIRSAVAEGLGGADALDARLPPGSLAGRLERHRQRAILGFTVYAVVGVLLFLAVLIEVARTPWLGFCVLLALVVVIAWLRVLEEQDAEELAIAEGTGSNALDGRDQARREARLAAHEDRWQQNQLTAVTFLGRSPLRRWLQRLVLWIIDLRAAYWNTEGLLHGVPSIHFAHWLVFDRGRRLLFVSNYDGSWASYLDDFVQHAAKPLTAIWSHSVGFPRTRQLFFGGAADGPRFKRYARAHQVAPELWYSAYPTLSVQDIQRNTEIADGLRANLTDPGDLRAWFARL